MQTKYPIILVHGIVLKDIKFIKSFGHIDNVLKKEGFVVYKSQIDGFGPIKSNALQLKEEIIKIMQKENCNKVNIIAHSKGGLDAKTMIKELDMEDHIASLTTLCTPHKGSKVATNILKLPKWLLRFVNFWINFWFRIFKDKNPNALLVCQELAYIDSIEAETINFSNKVYCQSFSTTLNKSRDDFIMGIPLLFSHHFEKSESDGLVTPQSSMFGNYRGKCIEDSVSHSEIIDFMVRKKKKEKIYSFYLSLCNELKELGF